MTKKVAIVAVAQTKYEENYYRQSELVYQCVEKVLDETGLNFEEGKGIDAAVTASDDFWDARTISDTPIGDVVGAHYRTEEKVAQDSAQAAFYGYMEILSGHSDIVLVTAHCKESQPVSRNIITNAGFDPYFQRPLGLDHLVAGALQARQYMHKYGITREQCAKAVVKSHKNGKNNPYITKARDITVEDVLSSKMLASPISELDIHPVTDGACALILAEEEKARKITDNLVWIKGASNCYDAFYLGDRHLANCDSLVSAAKRAYKMDGIKDPSKEIDVAEISTRYSYQEPLWTEGLGFCGRGEGGKILDKGITEMSGEIPVNPSGGVLVGCPYITVGLARVAEITVQLRGDAGARQVSGAKVGLAHGTSGPCGQLHCVLILGK